MRKNNYEISEKYNVKGIQSNRTFNFPRHYSIDLDNTQNNLELSSIETTPVLDSDIDIFANLPKEIYSNKHVSEFLNALRGALSISKPKEITLSKLIVSEKTNQCVTLDWIFNYFRLYFSFDEDGDYYGIISNNDISGAFSNEFRPMKTQEYANVAKSSLDYVVMMVQG